MKNSAQFLPILKNKFTLTILLQLCALTTWAGGFDGWWRGEVMKLPIVIHIQNDTGSLFSPAQSPDSIPFSSLAVSGDSISFSIAALRLSYSGTKTDNQISGQLIQGMEIPLTFTPATPDDARIYRPQTPQPPFLYSIEEVTFPSGDLTMAGTLTIPYTRPFAAIVLVSGSGAQNRDEEIAGHKPFAVIADHLTRCGWAVVRYDDRGVGGSSKGKSTDTTFDFAQDAMAAVSLLRKRFPGLPIGILGHSEGGTIAMINAAQHPDSVNFIISLAGMAVNGRDLMIRQNEMLLEHHGVSEDPQLHADMTAIFDCIASDMSDSLVVAQIDSIMSRTNSDPKQRLRQATDMTKPWYRQFIRLNPIGYLQQIQCPVLALNGSWDIQVDADPNLEAIEKNVKNARTVKLPGLNHLFQESPSRGKSFDYASISQTFSPKALDAITDYLTDYLRSRK